MSAETESRESSRAFLAINQFVIHSFREGNTRSQFVFFSQLVEQAGYRIDAEQFAPEAALREEFVRARFHSQDTGDNERLAAVLRQAVVPSVRDPRDGPGARSAPQTMKATEAFRLAAMDHPAAPVAKPPTGSRAPEAFGATGYQPGRNQGPGLGR